MIRPLLSWWYYFCAQSWCLLSLMTYCGVASICGSEVSHHIWPLDILSIQRWCLDLKSQLCCCTWYILFLLSGAPIKFIYSIYIYTHTNLIGAGLLCIYQLLMRHFTLRGTAKACVWLQSMEQMEQGKAHLCALSSTVLSLWNSSDQLWLVILKNVLLSSVLLTGHGPQRKCLREWSELFQATFWGETLHKES